MQKRPRAEITMFASGPLRALVILGMFAVNALCAGKILRKNVEKRGA